MSDDNQVHTEDVATTENYSVWVSQEPDGEMVFHVDLGMVSLNLFREEWDELVGLMQQAGKVTQNRR
ncbi:MAG TPA: hypothetical protein PLQ56_08590 [Aggregatilineales bacterium]|nr:hypothetical protein [Anaerolineae bacterium]HUN06645.1 hypothetical protein [Aggregatilineales bacterium]